jgi:hypothetical protein
MTLPHDNSDFDGLDLEPGQRGLKLSRSLRPPSRELQRSHSESRMREIRTAGLMRAEEESRSLAKPYATALLFDLRQDYL